MANRKRKIVLRVPVTAEEQALIQRKMALLHTANFSAYARKMLIDGYGLYLPLFGAGQLYRLVCVLLSGQPLSPPFPFDAAAPTRHKGCWSDRAGLSA